MGRLMLEAMVVAVSIVFAIRAAQGALDRWPVASIAHCCVLLVVIVGLVVAHERMPP